MLKTKLQKNFFSKKLKKYYCNAYTTVIEHKKLSSNSLATQIFTKGGPLAFYQCQIIKHQLFIL